jgi:hypothetical protein
MDADELYDEFGNYVGPELSGSDEVRGDWAARRPAAAARWMGGRAGRRPPGGRL